MIEYALLIMLGFCIGGLIALLLAPTLWQRAVRLTTKRLEATMPMSLSDIEADKDLLRASYAIRLRRMEAALNKAREKSANQLVEISKHQMRIAELNSGIDLLNAQLEERRNAAHVFESTIRKRFPELEDKVALAQAALDERAGEIADLMGRLRRREEALEMAQRSAALQQDEIRQLRDTLERTGADTTGRFKKRASQWTLDEYRSEYDRLNGELSRIREQLVLAQERENRQVAVLKTELQQLAERIMVSATAEPKPVADWRETERQPSRAAPAPVYRSQAAPSRRAAAPPVTAPRPWPSDKSAARSRSPAAASPAAQIEPKAEPKIESKISAPGQPKSEEKPVTPDTGVPSGKDAPQASAAVSGAAAPRAAAISESEERAARDSLKSLLDRGAKLADKDLLNKAAPAATVPEAKAEPGKPAAAASARSGNSEENTASGPPVGEAMTATAPAATAKLEPKLDQVFREILEGRSASSPEGTAKAAIPNGSEQKAAETSSAVQNEAVEPEGKSDTPVTSEGSKTQTLLDRLRDIRERQTG